MTSPSRSGPSTSATASPTGPPAPPPEPVLWGSGPERQTGSERIVAAVGDDDRRDRRVMGERDGDRSDQQLVEGTEPARADDEEIGVVGRRPQRGPRVARHDEQLDLRVRVEVGQHGGHLAFQLASSGGRGRLGRWRRRIADHRLARVDPNGRHPSGPTKVPERPLQRRSGVRGSVEPDDHVEPIVDGRNFRGNQRNGHRGVPRAVGADGTEREVDRGNSTPWFRPRAAPIPPQRRASAAPGRPSTTRPTSTSDGACSSRNARRRRNAS